MSPAANIAAGLFLFLLTFGDFFVYNLLAMKKTKIIPLGDRVLVKPFTEADLKKTEGEKVLKFILPESMTKEKSAQGKVLAVGNVKTVKVGDIVIFSKYSYDEVDDLYLIKEENILAKLT